MLLAGPECKILAFHTSVLEDIRVCSDVAIPGEEYPNEDMVSFKEILDEVEKNCPVKKVGIADLDLIPNFLMENVASVCGDKEIINAAGLVDDLRMIKSKAELRIMTRAYEMGIAGINKGLEELEIGKTESQITGEMAYPVYQMGADQLSNYFCTASGRNSSPALNFPSGDKVIEDGDFVILDIGGVYKGYFSDIATTVIMGKKENEKQRILDTAKRALDSALKSIKPGIPGKVIDLAARDITNEAGYGKNHLYGCCHGVGLQHCEPPFFGPNTGQLVEEDMLFNIDLGLFGFDFGGIRLETGVIVTGNGCKIFEIETSRLK
jgi:Xaa-Pro aminopeptidase